MFPRLLRWRENTFFCCLFFSIKTEEKDAGAPYKKIMF